MSIVKNLLIAVFIVFPGISSAGVITSVLPETNVFDLGPFDIGTFDFVIPDAEHVISASISGAFGNQTVAASSAATPIIVDDIEVAFCGGVTGCSSFSFVFDFEPADVDIFNDGLAVVRGDLQFLGAARISGLTLTLTTAPVPEPTTLALFVLGAFGAFRSVAKKRLL